MGLGSGSGVVLMMASDFSASTFPMDNTGTADTYLLLPQAVRHMCSHTSPLGKQLRVVAVVSGSDMGRCEGSMCLHIQALEICVTCLDTRLGSIATLMPAFTLPKTPVLSTRCTRNPGFLVLLLLFEADLREW